MAEPQPECGQSPTSDERPSQGSDDSRTRTNQKSPLQEIVQTVLLAAFIFAAIRLGVLNFRVDGPSMEPTLSDAEMILVNRRAYMHVDPGQLIDWLPGVSVDGARDNYVFGPHHRGDIVVFDPPRSYFGRDERYIKRIIGLPGDVVLIQEGSVFVNGQRLDEPYIQERTGWAGDLGVPTQVPPGSVLVLGDNRNDSVDSRVFGEVPISDIVGRAWVVYWPLGAFRVISSDE